MTRGKRPYTEAIYSSKLEVPTTETSNKFISQTFNLLKFFETSESV